MRWIIPIIAVLIVLAWVGCQMDLSEAIQTDHQVVQSVWRHTASGWEKVSALSGLKFQPSAITDVWNSHPHPVIIASLVAMLSFMALLAFNPAKQPATVARFSLPNGFEDKALPPGFGEQQLRSRAWLDPANSPPAAPIPVEHAD